MKRFILYTIIGVVVIGLGTWLYLPYHANQKRIAERTADLEAHNPKLLAQIQEAITKLEAIVKDSPKDSVSWFELGTNKKNIGDYLGAESALKKAIDLDKESLTALNNLGLIYEEEGKYKQAEALYREMVNRQKYFTDGYVVLAHLYEAGNYKSKSDAEQILLFGLTVIKDSRTLLEELERYYQDTNQPDKAAEIQKRLGASPTATPRPAIQIQ